MRLQRRLSQNPTEARPDGLSSRHLLQSPDRPVGQFQSVLLGSCTSPVFPARPLQGGNPARPPGPGGVVHGFYPPRLIAATYPPDGGSMLPDLPTYSPGGFPTESGPAGRPVVPSSPAGPGPPIGGCLPLVTAPLGVSDRPWDPGGATGARRCFPVIRGSYPRPSADPPLRGGPVPVVRNPLDPGGPDGIPSPAPPPAM